MKQDLVVGKLMLNIQEGHVDTRTALAQAYAAGYDERMKKFGQDHAKRIIQLDINGNKISEFESQLKAAKKVKCSDRTILQSLKTGKKTRQGHYWKYAS